MNTKHNKNGLDLNQQAVAGLDQTVKNFEVLLEKRLKDRQQADNLQGAEKLARHARIYQGMSTIRRALQETCKIKIGDRFYLNLEVSDSQGWPKLNLQLLDRKSHTQPIYVLEIFSHDLKEQGMIELWLPNRVLAGQLSLATPEIIQQIPALLKKTVRSFLDLVGDYILNPNQAREIFEKATKQIESPNLQVPAAAVIAEQPPTPTKVQVKEIELNLDLDLE